MTAREFFCFALAKKYSTADDRFGCAFIVANYFTMQFAISLKKGLSWLV